MQNLWWHCDSHTIKRSITTATNKQIQNDRLVAFCSLTQNPCMIECLVLDKDLFYLPIATRLVLGPLLAVPTTPPR